MTKKKERKKTILEKKSPSAGGYRSVPDYTVLLLLIINFLNKTSI